MSGPKFADRPRVSEITMLRQRMTRLSGTPSVKKCYVAASLTDIFIQGKFTVTSPAMFPPLRFGKPSRDSSAASHVKFFASFKL